MKSNPLRLLVALLALILSACDTPTPIPPLQDGPTPAPPSNWYSLYFTDPGASDYFEGGPDEALAAAIDAARLSVEVAAHELDLDSVADALLRAHQRGVAVRLVLESNYLDEKATHKLIAADIPWRDDQRDGLMHNKFVVIDRLEVWTGSMNFTSNGAYRNNNNLIRIRSSKLAENYLTEFNEMFEEDLFGPDKRANTPSPSLTISGTAVETYFSPDDGVARHLLDLVDGARQSICFLAFSFTSDDLGEALLAAHQDGVTVSGVFETSQVKSNGQYSEYDTLRTAGLDVWLDANPRNMHHKVFVIDQQVVWTGSYNFSTNAEKTNDENVLVIHNAEIATLYQAECKKLVTLAQK